MLLALESSCDETALALFDPDNGFAGEWVRSQIALHEAYGGVVPDLASREHLRDFPKLLARARDEQPAAFAALRQIAVTAGPGLAGCLAIGLATAKALALALDLPLAPVNHLRAHILSPFLPLHARHPA
ncbi:MAG: tRNA (adenosine(37)-N6)-threonylcarbamoyltransferase complex transferase subunit TsaD, partial [Opitutaceae bacterium]|nr:tRNA (adenosine(37)-N6)-threonylcarbamoyltransferase complex transferase subunit TsaD [Opitutaceae bacterium]